MTATFEVTFSRGREKVTIQPAASWLAGGDPLLTLVFDTGTGTRHSTMGMDETGQFAGALAEALTAGFATLGTSSVDAATLVEFRHQLGHVLLLDPSMPGGPLSLLDPDDPAVTDAYRERNTMVLTLVGTAWQLGLPAGFRDDPNPVRPEAAAVAYVELPGGMQVSWHVPSYPHPYDGHTTMDKQNRIVDLLDAMASGTMNDWARILADAESATPERVTEAQRHVDGAQAEIAVVDADEKHDWRCDYAQRPVPPHPECYCESPAEIAARRWCGHAPERDCQCDDLGYATI